jgi:hypothetical protein
VVTDSCPYQENAVGWALYALEPAEEHAARAHLPNCPVCRRIVRSTEQVAALLGTSAPQHEPPSYLRRQLLAAVRVPERRRPRGLLIAAAAVILALGAATTVLGVRVSQQQSVIANPAAKRAVLTNTAGKPAAVLITGPTGATVIPLTLPPHQHYVAWGLRDAGPTPLAAFDVTADSGPITLDWPASAGDLSRFAISLEPGRGLPTKPTDVIASGSA